MDAVVAGRYTRTPTLAAPTYTPPPAAAHPHALPSLTPHNDDGRSRPALSRLAPSPVGPAPTPSRSRAVAPRGDAAHWSAMRLRLRELKLATARRKQNRGIVGRPAEDEASKSNARRFYRARRDSINPTVRTRRFDFFFFFFLLKFYILDGSVAIFLGGLRTTP